MKLLKLGVALVLVVLVTIVVLANVYYLGNNGFSDDKLILGDGSLWLNFANLNN